MKVFVINIILLLPFGILGQDCSDYTYEVCRGYLNRCWYDCPPFQRFPRPNLGENNPVAYQLHTQQHADYEDINHENTGTRFDAGRPTMLVVHGFSENPNTEWLAQLTQTLKTNLNYNTIIVDWRWGALPDPGNPVAPVPGSNTRLLGAEIHLLLEALRADKGLNLAHVHCVGFSLGAHGCAFLGKRYTEDGQSIGRITGLDPGNDIFVDPPNEPRIRLTPSDANFVDVIHTNARGSIQASGVDLNCGNVDFWPHQGGPQPGCGALGDVCNHRRAANLFRASVVDCQFMDGEVCSSYDDMREDNCQPCSGSNCQSMGLWASEFSGRGTYLLKETGEDYPFC